jgi:hypothetical protein
MLISNLEVFAPVMGLLINVFTQVIIFRHTPSLGLLKSVYLGFVIGFVSIFVFEFFIPHPTSTKDFIAILVTNLITYISLGYGYFHFINLGETARRIRILRELYESNDGFSLEELLVRYNAKEIIERRLSRLINNRQIIYKDERYYIANPTMLFITKIIVGMKSVILGKLRNSGRHA